MTPRDDGPFASAIRFMGEMLGWSTVGLTLLVSGVLLPKLGMTQTWVGVVWWTAGVAYVFYVYPRLPRWLRECRQLITDLRSPWQ
jgi:hypothetical protein